MKLTSLMFPPPRRSVAIVLATVFAAGALYFGLRRYVGTTLTLLPHDFIDDAFITYRYAENWSAGHGPVWNPGEAPIEGYSSPLYVAFLAVGHAFLGVDIPSFSKTICLVSGAATLCLLFAMIWLSTRRLFWAAVGTSVLAAHPCMAVWSAGGMETMLYTFLVVLSALGVFLVHRTNSAWAWVCLTSGLVLLSFGRTEGVLFSFAFGLYAIFQSNDELSWPRSVVCLLIVGATVGAHLLIRKWYYGLWFPLPVYAKGHEGMGLGMVLVALYSYPIQAVLGVLALALTKAPEVRSVLRFSVIATLLMCLILRNVDPVMQNHQRYLTPLIPLFYLAASIGLAELAATMKEGLTPLVLLAFAPFFLNEPQLLGADRNAEVAESISYSEGLRRSHVTLGNWLRENVPDRSTWVASTDCGVLPYYSKLKWIDLAGLNDAYLARNGGETGYVFDRRPELIILTPLRVDAPIRHSERLAQNYKLVGIWPGFYNLELFRRLDVPPFATERQGQASPPASGPIACPFVEGFERILEAANEGHYPDHRGGSNSFWAYYRGPRQQVVTWQTAVNQCEGPIQLAFTASLSEDPGLAELQYDGHPLLQFDLGRSEGTLEWKGPGAVLRFVPRGLAQGITGYFLLRLESGVLARGNAAELSVTPIEGSELSWFMLKSRGDTVSFEQLATDRP